MIEKYFGFVGFEPLMDDAFRHMKHARSIIFMGPNTSGKTSLIAACAKMMSERKALSLPMVITFCNPIKQFIVTIAEKLHKRRLLDRKYLALDWDTLKKRLAREHYRHTITIVLEAVRNYPGLFIGIDDLDSLTPTGRSMVIALIDAGAIVCGAATKRTNHLQRVLYKLQELTIPPMNEDIIRKITERFIDDRGVLVEDRKHFIENIVWKSSQNIGALDGMLCYFQNEPRIRIEDVRSVSQGAARTEFSIEWMIYAGFAFIVMLRFISKATMNRQLLIISSVLVPLLFILLRYVLAKGNRKD